MIYGILIDFKIEKHMFLLIKGFDLLGFPNNKYPPSNKNYLRCLFFGRGGRLVLGGFPFFEKYRRPSHLTD